MLRVIFVKKSLNHIQKNFNSLNHIQKVQLFESLWKKLSSWSHTKKVQFVESYAKKNFESYLKNKIFESYSKRFNSESHISKRNSFLGVIFEKGSNSFRHTQEIKRFNSLRHFEKVVQFSKSYQKKVQFFQLYSKKSRVQVLESFFFEKGSITWAMFKKKFNSVSRNGKKTILWVI